MKTLPEAKGMGNVGIVVLPRFMQTEDAKGGREKHKCGLSLFGKWVLSFSTRSRRSAQRGMCGYFFWGLYGKWPSNWKKSLLGTTKHQKGEVLIRKKKRGGNNLELRLKKPMHRDI